MGGSLAVILLANLYTEYSHIISFRKAKQQRGRDSYNSIGFLVEEVESSLSLNPTFFTAFVVQFAAADSRCILEVFVL